MPLYKGVDIPPEEAIGQDLCPECGRDIKELDIEHEVFRHWPLPPPPGPAGDEARKRIALMVDYHDKRKANAPLK
jgi:hypothetical protein